MKPLKSSCLYFTSTGIQTLDLCVTSATHKKNFWANKQTKREMVIKLIQYSQGVLEGFFQLQLTEWDVLIIKRFNVILAIVFFFFVIYAKLFKLFKIILLRFIQLFHHLFPPVPL